MADGIAVHRGIVEGRLGEAGCHVAGEHAAGGLVQRDRLRPLHRPCGGKQALQRIGDGKQRHQAFAPRL